MASSVPRTSTNRWSNNESAQLGTQFPQFIRMRVFLSVFCATSIILWTPTIGRLCQCTHKSGVWGNCSDSRSVWAEKLPRSGQCRANRPKFPRPIKWMCSNKWPNYDWQRTLPIRHIGSYSAHQRNSSSHAAAMHAHQNRSARRIMRLKCDEWNASQTQNPALFTSIYVHLDCVILILGKTRWETYLVVFTALFG